MIQNGLIRFFDIFFSSLAILVLLPFMLPVMIALKLTGEHDIFYLQSRVGRGGSDFKVIKFATMLRDSANMKGGVLTQKDDPRILPMGKILRKTKINELPQLINIFKGDMSVIGPRPQARRHYELYTDKVKAEIDKVSPGLSGLGSVAFRDEEDMLNQIEGDRDAFHDTVIAPYKGELELWFCGHRNIGVYFKLIFLTAWAVLRPDSDRWKTAFKNLPPIPEALIPYL